MCFSQILLSRILHHQTHTRSKRFVFTKSGKVSACPVSTTCLNHGSHFGIYSTSLQHLRIDTIPALFLRAAAECVSSCYSTVQLFQTAQLWIEGSSRAPINLWVVSRSVSLTGRRSHLRSGASPPVRPVPANTTPQ